jgi:hypothetical protein
MTAELNKESLNFLSDPYHIKAHFCEHPEFGSMYFTECSSSLFINLG